MKRERGDFTVTSGSFHAGFPAEQSAMLGPYLGQYVDVEFSVIKGGEFGGWLFERIQRITVIEETPEAIPIVVTITPAKKVFTSLEPIVAKVVLENRSKEVQGLWFNTSHTVLAHDYEKVFWLEAENHYDKGPKSYRFEGKSDVGELKPGERAVFTVESRHMAEPGRYDLSYVVSRGSGTRDCFSEPVPVEVVAATGVDRAALLKSWMKRAALEDRTDIAKERLAMGDRTVVAEFLEQVKSGLYHAQGLDRGAYEFAIKHGGEAAEKMVMNKIKRARFQETADDFMAFLFRSKDRVRLLTELTACQHAVEVNVGGWVEHPRICDIVANMLMQQTRGKMEFPCQGSEAERNAAVALVQSALKEDPLMFEGVRVSAEREDGAKKSAGAAKP